MRSNMTLKLCPLLTLLISVVGCGKKATESADTSSGTNIQNQEPATNVVMALDTSGGKSFSYRIKRNAVFTLPDILKIKSGSLPNRKVSIKFGQNPEDSADYSLKCDYLTSSSQPELMEVETCYDSEGNDVGNYTSEVLPMYAGYAIKMELVGAVVPAEIYAYLTADWK